MSAGRSSWPRTLSILGAGGFARQLARALRAEGVTVERLLTSGVPREPMIDGVPVQQADAWLLAAAPVAVGIFNREPASDYAALQAWALTLQPRTQLLWPQVLYDGLAHRLGFRYWLHPLAGYRDTSQAQAQARALLDDEPSRERFDQVLAFRRAAWASPPQPEPGPQYLPGWLASAMSARHSDGLHLVDAGAYRGETLLELSRHLPVRRAWAIEPDPQNHAALQRTLAGWPGQAEAIAAALSDQAGRLPFSAGSGEASRIGESTPAALPGPDDASVAVVPLDDVVAGERVDFIKFDVEGHEAAALRGATTTLRRCRPVLAIAAYHRWDDLWQLPLQLAGLGLGYRLRLGVHAHNSFDTVLYAH